MSEEQAQESGPLRPEDAEVLRLLIESRDRAALLIHEMSVALERIVELEALVRQRGDTPGLDNGSAP